MCKKIRQHSSNKIREIIIEKINDLKTIYQKIMIKDSNSFDTEKCVKDIYNYSNNYYSKQLVEFYNSIQIKEITQKIDELTKISKYEEEQLFFEYTQNKNTYFSNLNDTKRVNNIEKCENEDKLIILTYFFRPNIDDSLLIDTINSLKRIYDEPFIIENENAVINLFNDIFFRKIIRNLLNSKLMHDFFDTNKHGLLCKDNYESFLKEIEIDINLNIFFNKYIHLITLPHGKKGMTIRYLNIFINKDDFIVYYGNPSNYKILQSALFTIVILHELIHYLYRIKKEKSESSKVHIIDVDNVNEGRQILQVHLFNKAKINQIYINFAKAIIDEYSWKESNQREGKSNEKNPIAKLYNSDNSSEEYLDFMEISHSTDWCGATFY